MTNTTVSTKTDIVKTKCECQLYGMPNSQKWANYSFTFDKLKTKVYEPKTIVNF